MVGKKLYYLQVIKKRLVERILSDNKSANTTPVASADTKHIKNDETVNAPF